MLDWNVGSQFSWIVFASVGLGATLVDVLWTLGIRRISQGRALESAMFSGIMTIANGLVIMEFVNNKWYLIAAAIGAFVGNYVTMRFDLRKRFKMKKRKKVI